MAWRRPSVAKQLRPWNFSMLPSDNIIMVNNPLRQTNLPSYDFRVPPHMNKFQIADYLEAVYDLRVKKVHTVNYDGKMKTRNGKPFRQKAYKRATVYFHDESVDGSADGSSGTGESSSSSS